MKTATHLTAAEATLEQIDVDRIDRNPDNPRLHFRQGELELLLDSINEYGVQVPISVYKDGRRYVLIDGERRWRCASKLGLETIPALVQARPSSLENLLMMFNIHALREQWDYLTMALKLPAIMDLIERTEGQPPSENDLAARTGLTRAMIRRCKLLLNLPDKYLEMISVELSKPKGRQKFTEDFFIEMERSLRVVERNMPVLIQDEREKESIRRVLIDKYKKDIIPNRIHFRKIAKIARAKAVEADPKAAEKVLRELFQKNTYSIERAYDDSVSIAYVERDLVTRIDGLIQRLHSLKADEIDDDMRARLRSLIDEATQILERSE